MKGRSAHIPVLTLLALVLVATPRSAVSAQDVTPIPACPAPTATPPPTGADRRQLVLEARPPAGVRITPETICVARDVMAARLDEVQVAATVNVVEDYRVVVEVAGDADLAAVTRLVTPVGLLEVIDPRGQMLPVGTLVTTSLGGPEAVLPRAAYAGEQVDDAAYETIIGDDDIEDAYRELDQFGMLTARVELTEDASGRLFAFTSANIGRPLAIVLDKRVISTPIIQDAVSEQVIISGQFTEDEVAELVASLDLDPLPVPFEVVTVDGTPVVPGGTPAAGGA